MTTLHVSTLTPVRRLALLRLLVGVVAVLSADVWHAPALTVLREPELVGVAVALRAVVVVSGVCTAAGLWTTATATVLTLSLFGLLGLVQRQGTPIHVHHLVWCAALVAVARTGRAWSIDAWRRGQVGTVASNDDSDDGDDGALRAAAVVLGVVYFWPGLHKLLDAASPFFDGDALVRLVRLKAIEAHAAVRFNLDAYPTLLLVGGWLVIAGELAVLPLVLLGRARLACVVVVALHASFTVVLHMPYTVLWIFALVFALVPSSSSSSSTSTSRAVAATALVIVVGASVFGVRGAVKGWPFACYPTFSSPVPTSIRVLRVQVDRGDGAGFVYVDDDAVVPDDLRTPLTFATRSLRDADDVERFMAQRRTDQRFANAIAGAHRLRVTSWRRHLDDDHLDDEQVLLERRLP